MFQTISRYNNRSHESELLDADTISKSELWQNLSELDTINRLLGGHIATLKGLKKLMTDNTKTYLIYDIGCGGGDTLKIISNWAQKNNFKVKLIGLDIKPEAIEYAKLKCQNFNDISFVCDDFNNLKIENNIDIIISSLFCHHIYDKLLSDYIKLIHNIPKIGFVINDLHRHWLAGESIKWLTHVFSKSYLVKNDARLSVNKGFIKTELAIFNHSKSDFNFQVMWVWAFRWLIVGLKTN